MGALRAKTGDPIAGYELIVPQAAKYEKPRTSEPQPATCEPNDRVQQEQGSD